MLSGTREGIMLYIQLRRFLFLYKIHNTANDLFAAAQVQNRKRNRSYAHRINALYRQIFYEQVFASRR